MTNNTKELEQRIQELTAQLKSHENREYKSRLFSFIFGREEKIMDMLKVPQDQRKVLSIRLGKNCERGC